jgi:hypothetical protein
MATFHTVLNLVQYYNVGCQALSHDRRFKGFSIESVILYNKLKLMADEKSEDLEIARIT